MNVSGRLSECITPSFWQGGVKNTSFFTRLFYEYSTDGQQSVIHIYSPASTSLGSNFVHEFLLSFLIHDDLAAVFNIFFRIQSKQIMHYKSRVRSLISICYIFRYNTIYMTGLIKIHDCSGKDIYYIDD